MVVSIAAILDACSIYLMTFFQKESPITNDVHVLLYPLVLSFTLCCWIVHMGGIKAAPDFFVKPQPE